MSAKADDPMPIVRSDTHDFIDNTFSFGITFIKSGNNTISEIVCSINTINAEESFSVTLRRKGASVAQSIAAMKTRTGDQNLVFFITNYLIIVIFFCIGVVTIISFFFEI